MVLVWGLTFGIWSLFGFWSLDFGVSFGFALLYDDRHTFRTRCRRFCDLVVDGQELEEAIHARLEELLVEIFCSSLKIQSELDAVPFGEPLGGLLGLDAERVIARPDTHLQTLRLRRVRFRLVLALFLLLIVQVLPVLHNLRDGRNGVRGYLDEIEARCLCRLHGISMGHHSHVGPFGVDDAKLRRGDPMVDADARRCFFAICTQGSEEIKSVSLLSGTRVRLKISPCLRPAWPDCGALVSTLLYLGTARSPTRRLAIGHAGLDSGTQIFKRALTMYHSFAQETREYGLFWSSVDSMEHDIP